MARYGDPRLPERFWDKVQIVPEASAYPGPCWIWTAALSPDGYARYHLDGWTQKAHRVAYAALVGPIPDSLQGDHLCRVTMCVNPVHIDPVPPRENVMRSNGLAARNAAAEACVNGHPFTPANIYLTRAGKRACRSCDRSRGRAYKARVRAAEKELV